MKGRSHTSVVRGLVFSFQFFHNSDEKMKVIQPLKLDIDFYDVVVVVAVAGQERAGCLGSLFQSLGVPISFRHSGRGGGVRRTGLSLRPNL